MRKFQATRGSAGFTIIELMVTILIASVLAAVGIPAMGNFLKNERITSQANAVVTSLHYSRNESISRGVDVRLEPLVAGIDWSAGWRSRIDGNDDKDFADAQDVVIRNFEAVSGSTLASDGNTLTYQPDGSVTATRVLTLTAQSCDSGNSYIRQITVSLSGHVVTQKQTCP